MKDQLEGLRVQSNSLSPEQETLYRFIEENQPKFTSQAGAFEFTSSPKMIISLLLTFSAKVESLAVDKKKLKAEIETFENKNDNDVKVNQAALKAKDEEIEQLKSLFKDKVAEIVHPVLHASFEVQVTCHLFGLID